MATFVRGASLAAALCFAAAAQAQDAERGRLLYETYCGECHYERVHDRPAEKSKVHTLAELRSTIAVWALQTRLKFTPADIDDIAEYLNRSHYKMAR